MIEGLCPTVSRAISRAPANAEAVRNPIRLTARLLVDKFDEASR